MHYDENIVKIICFSLYIYFQHALKGYYEMNDPYINQTIRELLLQCLRNVPAVRNINNVPDDPNSLAYLAVDVDIDCETFRLVVEIGNNGQPRYARDAVARLFMKSGPSPANTYPIFAAPFISKSAAEICREAGAGYIDLAGNCRLAFDRIYIERQGQPNRHVSRRSLRSLYQTRSSRVLRALLFDPNLKWKLADLSVAAGVSIGQVFNVKKSLVDREWAVFEKDGLQLTQPDQVLRDWGKHYTFEKNTLLNFRSPDTLSEMESRLAHRFTERKLRYALTSFSAFARLAPAVEHNRVFAYVDMDADRAAEVLQLNPVDSEPDVTIMLPYDEGVFFGMKEIEGMNTVSPIQAYLDLAGLKGAGEEAAETLFNQVIQKEWE
jgi:hypothetical protein